MFKSYIKAVLFWILTQCKLELRSSANLRGVSGAESSKEDKDAQRQQFFLQGGSYPPSN